MNQFKDFEIKNEVEGFVGDKIKMDRILNRAIVVHDFAIEDSKITKDTKCLYLQISISETKHVVFTGSKSLLQQIQKVPASGFPFSTEIIKENERLVFT